jgi:hypothetical protein
LPVDKRSIAVAAILLAELEAFAALMAFTLVLITAMLFLRFSGETPIAACPGIDGLHGKDRQGGRQFKGKILPAAGFYGLRTSEFPLAGSLILKFRTI